MTKASRDELLARKRARYAAHREERQAEARAYYAANRTQCIAATRKWQAANPETARSNNIKWMADHPERCAYINHKGSAKQRGIPFLLTFEEWLGIWTESGMLALRGPRSDQYVMARFGDAGPYAVGNVRICSTRENNAERNRNQRGKPLSEARRMVWAKAREIRRANMRHGRGVASV